MEQDRGAYLICDNGYFCWPTSICPYAGSDNLSLEGFFLTNLESVRKDMECTFGILKKRWSCAGAALNHSEAPPNYQYPEFSLQKSEGESTLVHISSRDSAQYDLFLHPCTFGAYSHGSMLPPQTDHPQYH